jgi:Zn-dependent protease with chaperone function
MTRARRVPPAAGRMDETFFAAQRRHRRTARVYSALAAAAALAQAVPAAVVLMPVTLAVAMVVGDVVNLVTPVPDLAAGIFDVLMAASEADRGTSGLSADWAVRLVAAAPGPFLLALVPGLLGTAGLWWAVRRFLLRDGLGGVLLSAGGRPPDRSDDEEHQLVNVVEEISIAAGIRPPAVLVLPADVPNAAAFGRDPDRATIAVSRGLLDDLDRDATQGVVAHLVATVANGDLRMKHSLLAVFLTYALAAELFAATFSARARERLRGVWRLLRGRAGPEEEAAVIRDLLAWSEGDETAAGGYLLMWRFMQLWTNLVLVGGLLVLPFRARKYLADATAVQLTRTPDGLGRALVHLGGRARPLPGAEWAAIYAITSPLPAVGDDGLEDAVDLPSSLHPPVLRRLDRLARLGFRGHIAGVWSAGWRDRHRSGRTATWSWPMRRLADLFWISLAPVLAVLLALLAVVSLAGLFISTMLIAALHAGVAFAVTLPIHALLRFLA